VLDYLKMSLYRQIATCTVAVVVVASSV